MPGEGAFEFACRIAHRQGLWIWLSADGERIIVGKPDFDESGVVGELHFPRNVMSSTVHRDLAAQPSVVVATGSGRGGSDHNSSRDPTAAYALNPSVRVRGKFNNDPPKGWGKKEAGSREVAMFPQPTAMLAPYERPMFLRDDAAQTVLQLEHFLRRELSLMQRKALTVQCTVQGHGQEIDGAFVPFSVDSRYRYVDEDAGIDEELYVLGRTFNRSRTGGSTTRLELIRLHTLSF